jgi:hypothetical protein
MFAFKQSIFDNLKNCFNQFINENQNNDQIEFYLPTVVDDLLKDGKVKVKVLPTSSDWFGLTYKEDKEIAVNKINNFVNQGRYPKKLW